MLKLSVEIELEGFDGSRMAAAGALRVAFLSSAVGGAIRGWTINEITLVDEGNAAFDALRDVEGDAAGAIFDPDPCDDELIDYVMGRANLVRRRVLD